MPSFIQSVTTTIAGDPTVQAKAVATAISVVLGFSPSVVTRQGYAEVMFTPSQEDAIVAYLNALLSSSPGKVRMDIKMISIRVFLKNFWFVLAGPFMGGFITGRRSVRRK